MTRKKAIEIVVETAKCSWVPDDWKACAVHSVGKKWGRGYAIGFATKVNSSVLITDGIQSLENGRRYDFMRKHLEEKGLL